MAYIYRRIGNPPLFYDFLMRFLGAEAIEVRTAFGWVKTGKRELGLGQNSVYPFGISAFTWILNGSPEPGYWCEISNIFTGIHASGGLFGAKKFFFLHHHPVLQPHEDTVYLNDGCGAPHPVAVLHPAEGFKHQVVY
ncbi:hypothetical protein PHMEG_0009523 [Phytophthora megakarya]|uniref:Uncharacterized protein n=1 Tax=Phytophthora megakarya TaxID=4795 RepID=A0A225WG12_9STRA|nr:hypothetical protein PHMEG_0009523 [Phytophthora megakarya]